MTSLTVLVPDKFDVPIGSPDVSVVRYSPTAVDLSAHHDADVLVVWGNSRDNLAAAVRDLPNLKLVQTLAAGPDQAVAAGFDSSIPITSGRGLHDATVAEHGLGLILAAVRRFGAMRDAQREHVWDSKGMVAQQYPETAHQFTLAGSTVTIWGFGSIASHIAPMLDLLGARVVGVATTGGERHGYPVVADDAADDLLAETDVLVSIVPGSPDNDSLFDDELFGKLKKGAAFVNVGRGSTVNEAALVSALESGRLAVAAIDVTRQEPLPVDSPLWDAPNLLITPHVAGNRPRGASELLEFNLAALRDGTPLRNLVSR